jgi:hypothetical protein
MFLEKSGTTWARVNEVLCSTFDEIYLGVYAEARPPHALKCGFCNAATPPITEINTLEFVCLMLGSLIFYI